MTFTKRLTIIIPILWLGFVLSISFMEAWLKFQAEGVTQVIGLNIGRLIFDVLNKVELFFLTILLVLSFNLQWIKKTKALSNLLISLLVILLIQTFYLLPILDQNAIKIINGSKPSLSYFHFYYVFFEILKVVLLCIFSHKIVTKYTLIDKTYT